MTVSTAYVLSLEVIKLNAKKTGQLSGFYAISTYKLGF